MDSRTGVDVRKCHQETHSRQCDKHSLILIIGTVNGIAKPTGGLNIIADCDNPLWRCPCPSQRTNTIYQLMSLHLIHKDKYYTLLGSLVSRQPIFKHSTNITHATIILAQHHLRPGGRRLFALSPPSLTPCASDSIRMTSLIFWKLYLKL